MKCIGITKRGKRCRNQCNLLYCNFHYKQPFVLIFLVLSAFIFADDLISAYLSAKKFLHNEKYVNDSELIEYNKLKISIGEYIRRIDSLNSSIDEILNQDNPTITQIDSSFGLTKEIDELNILLDYSQIKLSNYKKYYKSYSNKNSDYKQIIELYEDKDSIKLSAKLKTVFSDQSQDFWDEKIGLVVASYYALKMFDKAAYTVLVRNRSRKKWDHGLKPDLALCLRNYSVQNTLIEGIQLIDSLNILFNCEFLSKIWLVTPTEEMWNIHFGLLPNYNNSNIKKGDINYILKKFPGEPYSSVGFLLLDNHVAAGATKGSKRMEDVILISKIDRIYRDIGFYKISFDNNLISKRNINKLRESIKLYKYYVSKFPNGSYFNRGIERIIEISKLIKEYKHISELMTYTAIKKNANIYAKLNFEYALKIYNERRLLEAYKHLEVSSKNSNYFKSSIKFQRLIINELPYNVISDYLDDFQEYYQKYLVENFDSTLSSNEYINVSLTNSSFSSFRSYDTNSETIEKKVILLTKIEVSEVLKILLKYENSKDIKISIIEELVEFYIESNCFHEALYLLENTTKIVGNLSLSENAKDIISSLKILIKTIASKNIENYIKVIWMFKYIKHQDIFANFLLDRAIEEFNSKTENYDYILYLKIRKLVKSSDPKVISLANQFMSQYLSSPYSDDVLAELCYLYFYVLDYPELGEEYIKKLEISYPTKNALDNAYFWGWNFYNRNCIGDSDFYCLRSQELNSLIKKLNGGKDAQEVFQHLINFYDD